MSTLSKLQQLRVKSKTTKKNSTIICLETTWYKIQKPHPNPHEERRVSADLRATHPKICRNCAPNGKPLSQKSYKII